MPPEGGDGVPTQLSPAEYVVPEETARRWFPINVDTTTTATTSSAVLYNTNYTYQSYGMAFAMTRESVSTEAREWYDRAMARVDRAIGVPNRASAQVFHDTEPEDL